MLTKHPNEPFSQLNNLGTSCPNYSSKSALVSLSELHDFQVILLCLFCQLLSFYNEGNFSWSFSIHRIIFLISLYLLLRWLYQLLHFLNWYKYMFINYASKIHSESVLCSPYHFIGVNPGSLDYCNSHSPEFLTHSCLTHSPGSGKSNVFIYSNHHVTVLLKSLQDSLTLVNHCSSYWGPQCGQGLAPAYLTNPTYCLTPIWSQLSITLAIFLNLRHIELPFLISFLWAVMCDLKDSVYRSFSYFYHS